MWRSFEKRNQLLVHSLPQIFTIKSLWSNWLEYFCVLFIACCIRINTLDNKYLQLAYIWWKVQLTFYSRILNGFEWKLLSGYILYFFCIKWFSLVHLPAIQRPVNVGQFESWAYSNLVLSINVTGSLGNNQNISRTFGVPYLLSVLVDKKNLGFWTSTSTRSLNKN